MPSEQGLELGIALTAWTARLAVAGYVARWWIDLAEPVGNRSAPWNRWARWCWTGGWCCFCLHVIAAFAFYHHWSHSAAWEHTRQQTLMRTGFDSGSGLLFNYLFLMAWTVDVVGWWRDSRWPRHRLWFLSVQAFMAFMIVNATVVFGPPGWWPVAAVFLLVGVGAWWRRWVVNAAVRSR